MMHAAIEVHDLTYDYPKTRALEGVSVHLPQGSITALVGPNGAGKSTLMRCMAALDTPLEGEVLVQGKSASLFPREIHRQLGYLPDFFGLYDELTVEQSLRYFAAANGVAKPEIPAACERMLARCGLTPYRTQLAGGLSRGWRQRLGMAQAMVHRPAILLLDEPASGLDPEARVALSTLMLDLKSEGMTILVSSHILSELEDYCDRMIILREGRVVEEQTHHGNVTAQARYRIALVGEVSTHRAALDALGTWQGVEGGIVLAPHTQHEPAALLKLLIDAGVQVQSFTPETRRLQDIYLAHAHRQKEGA
jgi:ABC-2 type transport system ATP-binding protein